MLVFSFAILLVFSGNSFLFSMNTWVDTNCYFTMGRSMLHGLKPYIDLYDQKGPLLHIVYYIAALISETTFNGVFIVEVIFAAIFLYSCAKLIELFVNNRIFSIISSVIIMMFITSSIAFGEGGGSVEELCTPFMMLTMYLTLKDVIDKNPLETRTSLIIGIFSAYTFFMKYTLCGFYFGLIVGIVLYYSIQKFNKQEYTKFVSAFFKGIFIVVILVLIYLVAVGNLYDMLIQYFYNNIFKYSDFNSNVLIDIFFAPVQSILDNPKYGMLIVLGFMYLLITLKNNSNILVITLTTLFFLCVGIYCGGVYYEYYGLPLCVFAFLGAIVIYEIVANAGLSNRNINILCLIILLLSSTLIINEKKPLLNRNISKDSSQYVFAEIINEEENPTLLNYNCLDAGFYFTTGIIPTCKYYYKPNHMSFIKEEQTNAINNREFTFFVSDRVVDNSNYELVKHVDYYYLYKLIEDNK